MGSSCTATRATIRSRCSARGARTSGSTTSCWSATRSTTSAPPATSRGARDADRHRPRPAHERSWCRSTWPTRRSSRSSTAGAGARSTSRAGRSGATTPSSRSGATRADRARGPDGTHDRGRRQLTGTEPVAVHGRTGLTWARAGKLRAFRRRGTSIGRRHRAVHAEDCGRNKRVGLPCEIRVYHLRPEPRLAQAEWSIPVSMTARAELLTGACRSEAVSHVMSLA